MLHASIAQCPVFGGKVKRRRFAREREKMRGVKQVVRAADFVAVVADSWWRANEALKKLKIEWDAGGNGDASDATITAMLREGLARPEVPWRARVGDAAAALATRREGDRGRVLLALPQPRDDGAADLHRVGEARRLRGGVDLHAERRGLDGGGGRDRRACRWRRWRCTR